MKDSIFKRGIALATITTMLMGSVAACGNNQQSVDTESTADTAEVAGETTGETIPDTVERTEIVISADTEAVATINGLEDEIGSWKTGGTEAGTLAGDDYSYTPVIYINGGTYEADKSLAGDTDAVTDTEISGLDLTVEKEAVNGIMINNSDYTISDSTININTPEADGLLTCDFSGVGSALAIFGDSSVTISDTEINADGVANLAVFADNGASALLDNVTLHADGGTLYEDYINSPDQGTMVAPPWILGIMGNARGTNLMGDDSTMSVVDSNVSASNWAVLSTDAGSNMYLNVANTEMTLTGSDEPLQADGTYDIVNPYTSKAGYGTYAIGNAQEVFLGTIMNVGTYATIFTGGAGYYGNLTAGESYDLPAADGSTHYTYEAAEDAQTVINSDTFGFMAHQGDNTVTLDGIIVNSAFTDFLIKSGNNTIINVQNGTEINADNGILLQLMDNDDSTTEFNPNHPTVGMAFGTSHEEYAGFPTEAIDAEVQNDTSLQDTLVGGGQAEDVPDAAPEGEGGPAPDGEGGMPQQVTVNQSVYNITDTALNGSIYNGIGWLANDFSQGNIKQMILDVNISGTASLNGAIASTSCIHATFEGQSYLKENGITAFDNDEDAAAFAAEYQATSFTLAEYFNIGQVANLVKSNGLNDINVTLADSAVWTVTGTSLIKSLSISGDAQVIVEEGITLTVDGTVYEAGTYTAADFQ